MIQKIYDKCPVLYGVLYGQGLLVFFVLLEYFLVSTGISQYGVVTDSFGIVEKCAVRKHPKSKIGMYQAT